MSVTILLRTDYMGVELRRNAVNDERRADRPHLSPREADVMRGFLRGRSYKQVADDLGLSLDTVRTYVRGLYKKLHVRSVSEAIACSLREGLV
jgi:DNA-binding NarL/FixJ family response regulator